MSVRKNHSQSKRKKSSRGKRTARKSSAMSMEQRKKQFIKQNSKSIMENEELWNKVIDTMFMKKPSRRSKGDDRADRQNDTLLNALLNRQLDSATIDQNQLIKARAEIKDIERDKRDLEKSLRDTKDESSRDAKLLIAGWGTAIGLMVMGGIGLVYGYKTGKTANVTIDDERNFLEFWADEMEYMGYEVAQFFDSDLKLPDHRFGDVVDDAYVDAKIELNKV